MLHIRKRLKFGAFSSIAWAVTNIIYQECLLLINIFRVSLITIS